jgi:hypothetical protein
VLCPPFGNVFAAVEKKKGQRDHGNSLVKIQ